jgi:hypothetical protein
MTLPKNSLNISIGFLPRNRLEISVHCTADRTAFSYSDLVVVLCIECVSTYVQPSGSNI